MRRGTGCPCAQGHLTPADTTAGKRMLKRLAGLIIGLRSNAQNRLAEAGEGHGGEDKEDKEDRKDKKEKEG